LNKLQIILWHAVHCFHSSQLYSYIQYTINRMLMFSVPLMISIVQTCFPGNILANGHWLWQNFTIDFKNRQLAKW
jgi:hypothetical protein